MSSTEKTVFSRRDFLRGFGQRLFPQAGKEMSDEEQGKKFFFQANYFMAAHCFRDFLGKDSQSQRVCCFLGVSLYWCGRYSEALEVFAKLADGTEHQLVCLYKGLCFAAEGQTEEALDLLNRYNDVSRPLVQRAVNVQRALREEGLPVSARELEKDIRAAIEKEGEKLFW